MKKLWLPVLVVVIWLLAFVAAPWYTGQKVEAKLDNLLTDLSANGILKFNKKSYNKGLFSSETEVSLSLDMSSFSQALSQVGGSVSNPEAIILKGEVEHGPFLFANGFDFAIGHISFIPEVNDANRQRINKIFGTDEPLTLSIQFNWDDSVTAAGSLIGFAMAEEGVTSHEARLSVNLTEDGNHLVSDFNWGGLTVAKAGDTEKSAKIGKVTFTSDQVLAMEDLWVGTSRFDMTGFEFKQMGMAGKADKLTLVGTVSVTDDKQFMNGTGELTLDKFSMNGVDYIEDLQYKATFGNLHAESLQKLAKVIREAQQAGGSPEAMQMAMGMQLMGIVPEMVKKGMTINIDALNAKVMGEQVTSSLSIEIAKGTDVTQGMAAIAGVSATVNVSISKALLEQFPQFASPEMLQGLMMQGFIFEEEGFIRSHAEFKDGQLSVNGKVMPIPGLSM